MASSAAEPLVLDTIRTLPGLEAWPEGRNGQTGENAGDKVRPVKQSDALALLSRAPPGRAVIIEFEFSNG
jgi:hypothetical protein